jgi:hypothetical protein
MKRQPIGRTIRYRGWVRLPLGPGAHGQGLTPAVDFKGPLTDVMDPTPPTPLSAWGGTRLLSGEDQIAAPSLLLQG